MAGPLYGVAGFMGSGKSTFSRMFASEIGADVLDGDKLAKSLMTSSKLLIEKVGDHFPVVKNGEIGFPALANIVFNSKEEMLKLNDIVHPVLLDEIRTIVSLSSKVTILDAALIPQWIDKLDIECAFWIDVDVQKRIKRVMRRNGLTHAEAEERVLGQMETLFEPNWEHELWQVVSNMGTQEVLQSNAKEIAGRLL